MPYRIITGDLFDVDCSAIVCSNNASLYPTGGISGEVYRRAGYSEMMEAVKPLSPVGFGKACLTPGFKLKSPYVIHTAAPTVHFGVKSERETLKNCYVNAIRLALKKKLPSIAFPLLDSNPQGFCFSEAFELAMAGITKALRQTQKDILVTLVLNRRESVVDFLDKTEIYSYLNWALGEGRFDIDAIAASQSKAGKLSRFDPQKFREAGPYGATLFSHPEDVLPFRLQVIQSMREQHMGEEHLWRWSNVTKETIHQVLTDPSFMPSKYQAVAIAFALHADLQKLDRMLLSLGYAMDPFDFFDQVIDGCISTRFCDLLNANAILWEYCQRTLPI